MEEYVVDYMEQFSLLKYVCHPMHICYNRVTPTIQQKSYNSWTYIQQFSFLFQIFVPLKAKNPTHWYLMLVSLEDSTL